MVKNRAKVALDIQMAITRLEEAPVALYRKVVWQIFERIVLQTPQFSGRAVANWNLSINAPDASFDANMGDDMELTASGYVNNKIAREKGDMKWAVEALQRAKAVLRRVRRGDKVYITNATRGDGGEAYLAEFQDKAFHERLRWVNRPYETAMESAALIAQGLLESGAMPIGGLSSNIPE